MRIIVSAVGTPPYGIENWKTWKIEPNEIQVSYDVTNLYPSIPIDKAIDVILQQLSEDYEDLNPLRTNPTKCLATLLI